MAITRTDYLNNFNFPIKPSAATTQRLNNLSLENQREILTFINANLESADPALRQKAEELVTQLGLERLESGQYNFGENSLRPIFLPGSQADTFIQRNPIHGEY